LEIIPKTINAVTVIRIIRKSTKSGFPDFPGIQKIWVLISIGISENSEFRISWKSGKSGFPDFTGIRKGIAFSDFSEIREIRMSGFCGNPRNPDLWISQKSGKIGIWISRNSKKSGFSGCPHPEIRIYRISGNSDFREIRKIQEIRNIIDCWNKCCNCNCNVWPN
jgi:hypothetical protein